MPVPIVRLPTLEYPRNALLDVTPMANALADVRRAQEFDARHALDTRRVEGQERRDDARLGLERSRLGLAQRGAQRDEEERYARVLGNVAETINGIQDDGARRTAWGRLVSSNPRMGDILRRYGQDPNDHVNGPGFIIAQTRDPLSRRATEANIAATQSRTAERDAGERAPSYRINDEGELERAPPAETTPGRFSMATPAAFRMPGRPAISGPQDDPRVPVQSPQGEATGVPGILMNRAPGGDTTTSAGGVRERDLQQLWPRVQAQDQTLTTPEINRAWTSIWGRQPRAGHIYNLRGQEVPNVPPGAGDRGTRDAIRGAIDNARMNVADAREALRGTSYVGRQASHATGIGTLSEVQPWLEIASRAVMHGLSGAQVNIPETEAYLRAFMPQPMERERRIMQKLDHLDGILTRIQQRMGGNWNEEDVLSVRNSMRKSLGLRELSMDQHRGTGRAGGRPPAEPPPPGQQEPRQRREDSGGGWQIRRID